MKEKNNKKINRVLASFMVTTITASTFLPTATASTYNPNRGEDKETALEYVADLIDIQVNSIKGFGKELQGDGLSTEVVVSDDVQIDEDVISEDFDESQFGGFIEPTDPYIEEGIDESFGGYMIDDEQIEEFSLRGKIKIYKLGENNSVVALDEMPQLELVDSMGNPAAETYMYNDEDAPEIYFFNLYNLSINLTQNYYLKVIVNDNGKTVTKNATFNSLYNGDCEYLSEGNEYNMSVTAYENVAKMYFGDGIDVNTNAQANATTTNIDALAEQAKTILRKVSRNYDSPYVQMDFDKAFQDIIAKLDSEIAKTSLKGDAHFFYEASASAHDILKLELMYYLDTDHTTSCTLAEEQVAISYTNDAVQPNTDLVIRIEDYLGEKYVTLANMNAYIQMDMFDPNMEEKIMEYDVKKDFLKIDDSDIYVKNTYDKYVDGLLGVRGISYAIGSDTSVVMSELPVVVSVNPYISIPKDIKNDAKAIKEYVTNKIKQKMGESCTIVNIGLSNDLDEIGFTIQIGSNKKAYTNIPLVVLDILGDMDGNGVVNGNDASLVLDKYNKNNATALDIAKGDMDGNGVLNGTDASLILDLYNKVK